MSIRVKKATHFGEYKIKILFSDGKTKIIDFKDWIFEVGASVYLKPLKDLEYFKKFDLDEPKYTICWPNGADFCPDVLYGIGKEIRSVQKRVRKVKSKKPAILKSKKRKTPR